jgi:hypothetical protein
VKTPRSCTQGYNVEAVVTEEQIVPMVTATKREVQPIGVIDIRAVAVADSGNWNY